MTGMRTSISDALFALVDKAFVAIAPLRRHPEKPCHNVWGSCPFCVGVGTIGTAFNSAGDWVTETCSWCDGVGRVGWEWELGVEAHPNEPTDEPWSVEWPANHACPGTHAWAVEQDGREAIGGVLCHSRHLRELPCPECRAAL